MSGTSHDAVDAAACELRLAGDTLTLTPLGHFSVPYPQALRSELVAALPPGPHHAGDRVQAGHKDRPAMGLPAPGGFGAQGRVILEVGADLRRDPSQDIAAANRQVARDEI
jgi:hypothetical protein